MMRGLTLLSVMLLSGCFTDGASTYLLSFGSYSASPAVVTRMTINGAEFGMVPLLVDGRSDKVMPRANAGYFSAPYPAAAGGKVALDVSWVEILTGRAWNVRTHVAFSDLVVDDSKIVEVAPIFGPNGLMLVTSDPVPTSESHQPTRDLARLCGTRSPSDDVDYRAAPDSLPDLAAVLHTSRPAVGRTECPAPKR